MMLKLRRGTVTSSDPLRIEVEGIERPAWADRSLVGEVERGDEVIVNTEALDLGLGSGGFDLVHANLTRGLGAEAGGGRRRVMKLNYTSLQHPVEPVERPIEAGPTTPLPVLVLPLHGHLAPAAWAAAQAVPGLRAGYVQTAGGALPGGMSRDVGELRSRGLLAGHVSAGPSYGAEREAISVVGAFDAAAELGWEAILAGPGPGILGSATRYGHGGVAALDTAHAALALGMPTLISPRLSGADPRPRHRGLSHHTAAVLELLLAPVQVPVPEVDVGEWPTPEGSSEAGPERGTLDELRDACGERHDLVVRPVDLEGYGSSGLPTWTMGREMGQDRLFFAAALASGRALAAAGAEGWRK
jgi:Protein of unknown function (DUF3866)